MAASAHNLFLGGQYQDITDAYLFKNFRASARPSEQHTHNTCVQVHNTVPNMEYQELSS